MSARPGILIPSLALLLIVALPTSGCGSGSNQKAEEGPAPSRGKGAGEQDREHGSGLPLRGGERIVFFGDSLATAGEPPYPALLDDALGQLGQATEVVNLAEPGSTSEDWAPGGTLFEQVLTPALDDADLLLLTVGGNDLERALGARDTIDAVARAEESREALAQAERRIGRNLRLTFNAIRESAPRARIVYVSYPDYSADPAWRERLGALGAIAFRGALGQMLARARAAGPDAVVDMLAAWPQDPDRASALLDGEYLTPAGHRLYAEEIASVLAGPGAASSP